MAERVGLSPLALVNSSNEEFCRHSDMGSLTLLFRQPVAALQVLTKEGTWKYVQPQMNALTVNIADALDFLTSK